ncbi:MAG: FAD/NAD(P)-binding protein [Myxococcota bacterium]
MVLDDTEWLIVGAGLHGAHLAVSLVENGVAVSDIVLLDPKAPIEQWKTRTSRLAMTHLRSPSVHHIAQAPFDLEAFAGGRRRRKPGFRGTHSRPKLELFNAHCDKVASDYGLDGMHHRGLAIRCEPSDDAVVIHTEEGASLRAKYVVLALGVGEPAWPESLRGRTSANIQHVFEPQFHAPKADDQGSIAVVGGGITAAQLALRFASNGRPVEMFVRHPLRVEPFDSDPCWIGPACMARFRKIQCLAERRSIIADARHRGSLPSDVKRALVRAREAGQVRITQAPEHDLGEIARSNDHVLLATGLSTRRPGGVLVDTLVENSGLPIAPCGYPVTDTMLRWHPRVFATGALGELELGPVARNIVGARRAAARISMFASARGSEGRSRSRRASA